MAELAASSTFILQLLFDLAAAGGARVRLEHWALIRNIYFALDRRQRMAFFDDPKILIGHLRHSFITSDDTGKLKSAHNHVLSALCT